MIATLAAKELKCLFSSPLAWVLIAVTQLLLAGMFLNQVDAYLKFQPQLSLLLNPPGATEMVATPLFGAAAMLLIMIAPLLSMGLIAEERRSHTLPLLFSAPLSLSEIVLGKFLGIWLFLVMLTALPAAMALSLHVGGRLDIGLLLAGWTALIFLSACLSALGLYFSCLTSHPAIAAIASLGALLGLWLFDLAAADADSLRPWSLFQHFEHLNRGILDTADLAYFAVFTLGFLALALHRLNRDRVGRR